MTAIEQLFQTLKAQGRKALMPFITAGDPDLEFSSALLTELVRRGCHLCELGIPYSDPIADGPVIQESYTRALAQGIKLADIFQMLSRLTPTLPAPVVTMVSYAIIYRHGPERYIDEARTAGVAGVIVPDLLVEEAGPLAKICRAADFNLIQLVTPTTSRERALRIAETSSGFIYYVSVTGITGERRELPPALLENVAWLKGQTELPVAIGFGIGQPDHVRQLAPVADGLIVGSAIVRRIAGQGKSRQAVLQDVGQFVSTLLAELEPPKPASVSRA
jgi:tryptophan synthase alpha chain